MVLEAPKKQRMDWSEWCRRFGTPAKAILILIGVGLVTFNFVRIIIGPIGDFHNHRRLGDELLKGHSLYLGPGNTAPGYPNPYPPFWAMAHAPLTIVSPHLAQVVVFLPMYLGSLGLLWWTLRTLTRQHLPLDAGKEFWATAVALIIGVQFVARDMAECGVNIALVALAWFAIYAWTHHRDWLGGASLGFAIALKMTPALFVPYFLWKRQWKIAGTTTLFAIVFTLAPVLVRGPTRFAVDLREWIHVVRGAESGNPAVGVIGPESVSNFALRPALARLMVSRPGNEVNLHGSNLLSLPPRTASVLVYIIELAIVASFAGIVGRTVDDRQGLPVLYECAGVSLLMLLLSPITWGHHCVGAVPALYLISRTAFYCGSLPRWLLLPLGYVLLSLGCNQAIIGKQLSLLMSGYSVVTWEISALLMLTLGCRNLFARTAASLPWGLPSTQNVRL